jgi:hypothetical protein
MYMPTAVSDESGQFAIEGLETGTYDVFGESDAAGYPNTAISFYSTKEPTRVVLGSDSPGARIVLNLGPRAGVLSGTVIDKITRKAIVSRHALHFIVKESFKSEGLHLVRGACQIPLADTSSGRDNLRGDRGRLQALVLRRCLESLYATTTTPRIRRAEVLEY